ncbi:MAG: helix-turn-helix domain-containing protein [Hassallia sp. WJT32-NPBG1]|jgi:transposase|nr:helix-turn-helix domain-containing protein [Hassallia sp. WJT32-NPBG1]
MSDFDFDLQDLSEDLTSEQIQAIVLLASGEKIVTIAERLNISTRSVEKWRKNPKFKSYLRMAMARMFEGAIAELVFDVRTVAAELKLIALDRNQPARVRVSAITAILSTLDVCRQWELDDRLAKLEELNYAVDRN